MARREKDVDMPRRGNFKGGMGQTSTTGGAKPKKTRGVATTEAVKKMKQKESSMAKPRAKPAKKAPVGMGAKPKSKPGKTNTAKAAENQRKNQYAPAPSSQRLSVAIANKNKELKSGSNSESRSLKPKGGRHTALSDNSVTRKRKPLATGARSSRTSGTGFKESSIMDTITRIRRGIYKPKRAAPPKTMSSKDRRKARTSR